MEASTPQKPQETKKDKILTKAEQLKGMSLLRNIHKITPQMLQDQDKDQVAIIKALGSSKIVEAQFLKLKGYYYNPLTREYESYRNPVMNERGLGNFISIISDINENIEFSSLDKKEIPKIANLLFRSNYPYFTIYHEDYELDKSDFNLIATALLTSILGALNKAKGAGHRNVVRGTYSEDLLGRYVEVGADGKEKSKSGKVDLSKLNPFKKARGF